MFKYSLSKYKYMCIVLEISPKMRIFASVNERQTRLKMFYVANIQNKYE